jgi:hypothetical protein
MTKIYVYYIPPCTNFSVSLICAACRVCILFNRVSCAPDILGFREYLELEFYNHIYHVQACPRAGIK